MVTVPVCGDYNGIKNVNKRHQKTRAHGGRFSVGEKDVDLTAKVSTEPDITRLGRSGPKPAHERTADEDVDIVDWERVAATDDFDDLVRMRARFLIPATVFFLAYYFTLLVLVGFFPDLMSKTVPGLEPVNFAYLFAVSQFAMVAFVTWAYLRAAKKFDVLAGKIAHDALATEGAQKS